MRRVAATRVIFTLCIFLTRVSAQIATNSDRPSFAIGVYDYAGIPAPLLAKAEKEITAVFGSLGIQVQWSTCFGSGASTCEQLLHDSFIQLNLMNRPMAHKFGLDKRWLGAAVGRTIYVFYQPLEETLGNENPEMPQVLVNLIAHELGHILLPSKGHSSTGIMRAIWSVRELQEDAKFTRLQQRQLLTISPWDAISGNGTVSQIVVGRRKSSATAGHSMAVITIIHRFIVEYREPDCRDTAAPTFRHQISSRH